MIDVSPELLSFIKAEYDRCQDTTLLDQRSTAIDRYNGEPYGDEEDGRSQVVARDTAETVDYMVISILRTFVAGDRIVEFVHHNSEAAHQATETIMHLLMDDQDGYSILHDWLKAGLLEKNAVAMTYSEDQPPKRLEVVANGLQMALAAQQGIEFKEAEPVEESGVDEAGEPNAFKVVHLAEQPPKFCDAAVPNEEFYCSLDARTITEAPMKGRMVRKTLSDLIAMGFEQDDVESIGTGGPMPEQLSQARDHNRNTDEAQRQGLARTVWWHEEFVTFDANGDGIAELLYVRRSHDFKIFSVDEMDGPDDHPFEDWSPFPMQHRRVGQSLADKVMDIERIRTVLLRQTLDGIYLANNPSTYVPEESIGENTIEDLLTVRAGRLVRYKGANPPSERQGGYDSSNGFHALEFMNGERESRTGITRLNQGLDADALNKTATGTALMQAQGQQVEEYLARNFANGVARLFTKKARLLKRYGKPINVPIDGKYVQVDPSQWPEDMIARPRVGLGSGRKDQRIQYRQMVIGMQAQALAAGLDIVDEQKMFNSAKGLINDVGLGDATEFFNDPSKPQLGPDGQPIQKQPKPDPEMAKVQAQVQQEQMKLQMQQQQHAQKLALQAQTDQAKLTLMAQQGAQQQQLDAQKAAFDAQLARDKATAEGELAQQQMHVDYLLNVQQIAAQERHQARAAMFQAVAGGKKREGGRLDK